MFRKFVTAAALVTIAAAGGSAFASSGYGPAPHYNPLSGAPASQRGVSVQTIDAETMHADAGTQAYGGVADALSQAGARIAASDPGNLFAHH